MSTKPPDRNMFLSGGFLPAYGVYPNLVWAGRGGQLSRTP